MNKIMGLDLGSRTCGVALSDALGMIASGITTIRFEEDDYQTCCDEIVKLIDQNKVEKVVIGLPKHMNGDEGIRAEISRDFGEMLKEQRNIQCIYWDERLSTVAAQKGMIASNMNRNKRKSMVDTMAAVVILQGYLDSIY